MRWNLIAARLLLGQTLALACLGWGSEELGGDGDWESDEAWLGSLLGLESDLERDLAAALGDDSSLAALEKELEAALLALRAPAFEGTLEVGAGWKRNALLSADGSVDAAFRQASVDFFALRPGAGERWELLAIGYGEYRDYDGAPGLEAEYLAMVRGGASRGKIELSARVATTMIREMAKGG